jgi:CMP-N-acetylneuraminic acid synthetase
VGRAGQLAASIDWIDHAIISTDDAEIRDEAVAHGLSAPFLRPDHISGDRATSVDMWRHAWLAAEDAFAMTFDVSVLLEPTSPMRRVEDITRTVDLLLGGNHAAAATVSPTPAHFTPHKTLELDAGGRIGFYLPTGAKHALRQTIPPYFHRNGLCYALRRKTLVEDGHILEDDCAAVIVDRHIVNIDETFELELAAWLLAREAV